MPSSRVQKIKRTLFRMTTPTSRVAIVTGAAQGIGRAIALRLADDGLDVAVSDLASQNALLETLATEIRAKGKKSIVVVADVAIEKEVQNLVQKTVADLGGLDVVRTSSYLSICIVQFKGLVS